MAQERANIRYKIIDSIVLHILYKKDNPIPPYN
jgi:hypothetical protein